VRDKLLNIVDTIFEMGVVPSDLRKTSIKPIYKEAEEANFLV